jgi:hypothetical protein
MSMGASAHGRDEGYLIAIAQGVVRGDILGVDAVHQTAAVAGQAGEASAEVAIEFANRQPFLRFQVQLSSARCVVESGKESHPDLHDSFLLSV